VPVHLCRLQKRIGRHGVLAQHTLLLLPCIGCVHVCPCLSTALPPHLEELPVLVPEEGGCVALQHGCQLRHAAGGVRKAASCCCCWPAAALQLVAEVGRHQLSGQGPLNQVTECLGGGGCERAWGEAGVDG